MKLTTLLTISIGMAACGQTPSNHSALSDISLIHAETTDQNYVAYVNQENQNVRLLKCTDETEIPMTRFCESTFQTTISTKDFADSLELPTGGFPRSQKGLKIAELAVQRATESNRPAEEIKKFDWYRQNVSDILDMIEGMKSPEPVTFFNYDETYRLITESVLRFHKDQATGKRYRYIGDGASWDDDYMCSQLGGKKWQPVEKGGQVDKRILVDLFKSNLGQQLPTWKVGSKSVKVISFDEDCSSEWRSVIYINLSDLANLTEANIQVDSFKNDSGICETKMPTLCVAD